MSVRLRNKTAAYLAIIGGVLIFIGGGTGMTVFLKDLHEIVNKILGTPNETLEMIFWVLIFISALGGIAVIIGGLLFSKNRIIIGRFVIALGAGIGIFGLIFGLILAFIQGQSSQFLSWLTTSFLGIGIILSLVARYVAK